MDNNLQIKMTSMENDLQWKTTSNIKRDIFQQPLVRPLQNFKLTLMCPNQTLQMFQMMTPSNGR